MSDPTRSPPTTTTLNYTLTWPHLENPSNTTFAGPNQIDICRCPRADLPRQSPKEPGHIYTRHVCMQPEVHFKTRNEPLWVLQAPHGPINMLRPALSEERRRRQDIHDGADPTAYSGRNFLFLTGPCPRGRYQAYATQKWLESLDQTARQNIECLSLLIQPYEEDCSHAASKLAYAELAGYIVSNLPGFKTLCLYMWDDVADLRNAASEFAVLLQRNGVRIVVGSDRWNRDGKEYNSASGYLEAMSITHMKIRQRVDSNKEDNDPWEDIEDDQSNSGHNETADEENVSTERTSGSHEKNKTSIPERTKSFQVASPITVKDDHSDDDWTDAISSPTSPLDGKDENWQIL